MPVYDFECPACGLMHESLVSIAMRDKAIVLCPECGKKMDRKIVAGPKLHKPGYQMQAVLSDGTEVPGHFGKDAKRERK